MVKINGCCLQYLQYNNYTYATIKQRRPAPLPLSLPVIYTRLFVVLLISFNVTAVGFTVTCSDFAR